MNNNDYNSIYARLSAGEPMDSILESISEAASAAEKEYTAVQKRKAAEAAIQKEREKKAKEKAEAKRAAAAKIIEAINDYSRLCGSGEKAIPVSEISDEMLDIYAAAIERSILMISLFS